MTDPNETSAATNEPKGLPPRPRWPAIGILIGLNVAIHLLWQVSASLPGLESFLGRNFVMSLGHLRDGRPWVLLAATFSHAALFHLVLNMMVLGSFGRLFELVWGPWRFLRFYVAAALFSSAVHCLLSLLGWPDHPALGASGAVSAVIVLFAILRPGDKILIFGLIPMPAWLATLLFVAWDAWGLVMQRDGGGLPIGHGAHLGGALFGLLYFFLRVRPELGRLRGGDGG